MITNNPYNDYRKTIAQLLHSYCKTITRCSYDGQTKITQQQYISFRILSKRAMKDKANIICNQILEVLQYHHIPLHTQTIIRDLYSNFCTSLVTASFPTPFTEVSRDVLQWECLSPLTFTLCFNTLSNISLLLNLHSLASLLTFYIRSSGFNLLTAQLSLQASSERIKYC